MNKPYDLNDIIGKPLNWIGRAIDMGNISFGKPKIELLRVVRSPEGEISLDFGGKKSGRGAYVCPSSTCLGRVRKSHRIERVLECEIPDAVWDRMEKELRTHEES